MNDPDEMDELVHELEEAPVMPELRLRDLDLVFAAALPNYVPSSIALWSIYKHDVLLPLQLPPDATSLDAFLEKIHLSLYAKVQRLALHTADSFPSRWDTEEFGQTLSVLGVPFKQSDFRRLEGSQPVYILTSRMTYSRANELFPAGGGISTFLKDSPRQNLLWTSWESIHPITAKPTLFSVTVIKKKRGVQRQGDHVVLFVNSVMPEAMCTPQPDVFLLYIAREYGVRSKNYQLRKIIRTAQE